MSLLDGRFTAKLPKQMKRNASALVRVAIWDKRADPEARASLEPGPQPLDVRVGRLVRADVVETHPGEFTVHALRPAKQLLSDGHVLLWEWSIIPLQPGEHKLSVVATNLADASGRPLNQVIHSITVTVEVADGQAPLCSAPAQPALEPAPQAQAYAPAFLEERRDRDSVATNAVAEKDGRASTAATPIAEKDGRESPVTTPEEKAADFFERMKSAVAEEWHPENHRAQIDPVIASYGTHERKTVFKVWLESDGSIAKLQMTSSSGLDFLDEEALLAFRRAGPFKNPPRELVSTDRMIHFDFAFIVKLGDEDSSAP